MLETPLKNVAVFLDNRVDVVFFVIQEFEDRGDYVLVFVVDCRDEDAGVGVQEACCGVSKEGYAKGATVWLNRNFCTF